VLYAYVGRVALFGPCTPVSARGEWYGDIPRPRECVGKEYDMLWTA
jgi:hypothetical protein